jgi:hypothetical protein
MMRCIHSEPDPHARALPPPQAGEGRRHRSCGAEKDDAHAY